MRLLAEERGTGTLEMLLTAPIRDWQVVFAKFAACFGFYLVLWLPTLVYLPVLPDLHADVEAGVHAVLRSPCSRRIVLFILSEAGVLLLSERLAHAPARAPRRVAAGVGGYLHSTKDAEQILHAHRRASTRARS